MASIAVSVFKPPEQSLRDESPLADALLNLLNTAEAAVECDRQAVRACLARAIALLLANQCGTRGVTTGAHRGGLPRWQANRLVAYIDETLGAPINGADLIALTTVSASHFFRTFKATFGEAPFAYVARRRIKRAQELMLTTSEPLAQIALACGLCDQSHLNRVFRRIVGVSPSAWRREYAWQRADSSSAPMQRVGVGSRQSRGDSA